MILTRFQLHCGFCSEPEVCAPERRVLPSRAGASGSHHLPWALLRVLQAIPKIKRLAGGSDRRAGPGCGAVCSRGAPSVFIPGRRSSAIAARVAGRRRGNGRAGKRKRDTGRRQGANRNGTGKAGAIGSGRAAGNPHRQRQLARPRGSSLRKIFFAHSCNRPGCYERFAHQRRSPLQRFCSAACRRALERVEERERRWKKARDLIRRY